MTRGDYRVGIGFNSSGDAHVDEVKRCAAALIDAIGVIDPGRAPRAWGEINRLKALAMTAAEEAAMWGVKAATKPEPE